METTQHSSQNNLIKDGERLDDLQRSNLYIIQDPARFCFGMDAVLLSGFASAKAGDHVLDMGTGTGILPLLMWAKTPAKDFTALEIQEESADMARRSVKYNNLEADISVVNGDIKEASKIFGKASFQVVTCNPPYMSENHGITNPGDAKAIARHEILCTLEDVVREASLVLVTGGSFYMVHRPNRLSEIITLMREYRLEPKRMRLVYPYVDKEPNMVLIQGVKCGKAFMTVEKPLIINEKDGGYTAEIKEVYGF